MDFSLEKICTCLNFSHVDLFPSQCVHALARSCMRKLFCTTCCRASCLFEESDGNSGVRVSTYATTKLCVCVHLVCWGHSCVTGQTQSGGGAVTHPTTRWVNSQCHLRCNLARVFNSFKARKAVLTSSRLRTGPDKGQEVVECL